MWDLIPHLIALAPAHDSEVWGAPSAVGTLIELMFRAYPESFDYDEAVFDWLDPTAWWQLWEAHPTPEG